MDHPPNYYYPYDQGFYPPQHNGNLPQPSTIDSDGTRFYDATGTRPFFDNFSSFPVEGTVAYNRATAMADSKAGPTKTRNRDKPYLRSTEIAVSKANTKEASTRGKSTATKTAHLRSTPPIIDSKASPKETPTRDDATTPTGEHIPRPRNAFLIFRSDFYKNKIQRHIEHDHRHISRIAGNCWKEMSEEQKDEWWIKADLEKQEHKRKYPDYKFTPMPRKTKSKRNVKRNTRSDINRTKKIADLYLEGKEGKELEEALKSIESTPPPSEVTYDPPLEPVILRNPMRNAPETRAFHSPLLAHAELSPALSYSSLYAGPFDHGSPSLGQGYMSTSSWLGGGMSSEPYCSAWRSPTLASSRIVYEEHANGPLFNQHIWDERPDFPESSALSSPSTQYWVDQVHSLELSYPPTPTTPVQGETLLSNYHYPAPETGPSPPISPPGLSHSPDPPTFTNPFAYPQVAVYRRPSMPVDPLDDRPSVCRTRGY